MLTALHFNNHDLQGKYVHFSMLFHFALLVVCCNPCFIYLRLYSSFPNLSLTYIHSLTLSFFLSLSTFLSLPLFISPIPYLSLSHSFSLSPTLAFSLRTNHSSLFHLFKILLFTKKNGKSPKVKLNKLAITHNLEKHDKVMIII